MAWTFCSRVDSKTLFYARFYWKSKTAFFDVYDFYIGKKYCVVDNPFKMQKCHWLVREDGFYLSRKVGNLSPPKLHNWS